MEKMPHGENATGENATWNEWKRERMEIEKNVKWKVCDMEII